MNLEKSKKNRWLVLIASCLVNLCIGSLYSWSVFAAPTAQKLGMTVSELSVVFALSNSLGPITLISGGYINDRLGPRVPIFLGGLLLGGGFFLCGKASSLPLLILGYGICGGLAMGFAYGATVSNAVKYFPDHKGLAGGLTTGAYGFSSVILPPAANFLIQTLGISLTYFILGTAFLLIICLSSLCIKTCPKEILEMHMYHSKNEALPSVTDKNWRSMLCAPSFPVMFLMLSCGAVSGLMILSQASSIAQNMLLLSAGSASFCVSVLALFNTIGRIISGFLSDKFTPLPVLRISFLVSFTGLLMLAFSNPHRKAFFYIGISLIGICFGTLMGIFPSFTASQFGIRHNSVNYGIMFCGFALAGMAGPTLMGFLLIQTGSYRFSFLIASLLVVLGFLLSICFAKINASMKNHKNRHAPDMFTKPSP